MGSKLAPHLQEIKRALGMTVDDKKLMADFKKLVEDYKVPVEEAKRSVIKKYAKVLAATEGLSVPLPNGQSIKGEQPRATVMHLSQLKSGDMGVSVVCRILEAMQMNIETKNGPKDIISGVIADESARLPFTSWVVSPVIAAKNVVRIENAYVKVWQGIPTVNIGEHTNVAKVDDVLPPDTELSAPKRLTIYAIIGLLAVVYLLRRK